MDDPRRISVIEDPRFLDHVAPRGHPECPERLLAVARAIEEAAAREPTAITRMSPRVASDDEILRIHALEHLRSIEASVERAPTHLDPDTYVSADSYEVARLAAGSCIDAALAVARGEATSTFAALRPPGHHAEADRPMGFCLFNNVAIAARALQAEAGIDKILVLDWDVHHGNGTQHSFEDDPSILYFSTHQFPFYPGTGAFRETGVGRGVGATVNVPMPAGCGDSEYVGVFQHIFVPVVETFAPDIILISCGFDAHHSDPLGAMNISAEGYLAMTRVLRALAERVCGGRLCFVLEGGYSPIGLEEGTTAVLSGLLEPAPSVLPAPSELLPGSNLSRILSEVSAVHRNTYRNIS